MEEEKKLVIIGGVPGVGKTTVINYVIEEARKENLEINVIVFGSVMTEVAHEKYNITNRDELRKLKPEMQKEIQEETAQRIAEIAKGKLILVDTHYAIKTGTGTYLQGIPSWVSDVLDPQLLILIETYPADITQRRSLDKSRERDDESIEIVQQHQEINRTIAATICHKNGALMAIVYNMHGAASEAAHHLLELLKKL